MNTSACAKLGKSEQIGKSHNYPGIRESCAPIHTRCLKKERNCK